MSDVIIVGPDEPDFRECLAEHELTAERLPGAPIKEDLAGAGGASAAAIVLTDVAHASLIPVAKELNPDIQVILYTASNLPPFASAQADLSVDPGLISPAELAAAIHDRATEATGDTRRI